MTQSTSTTDRDAAGTLQITVTDKHHGTVDQLTLDAWELRRARIALALLTEALRGEAMVQLLAPQIEAADQRARQIAAESKGEWGAPVESVFEVRGLRADEFLAWFGAHFFDEAAMRAANPDHYEIRMAERLVTETLGGIPTRFQVQVDKPVDAPGHFEPDPAFPVHPPIGGRDLFTFGKQGVVATLLDGSTPVALLVGMQMRDTDDGFAMKNTLFFPAAAPAEMLVEHYSHYAIEFSRWITMAHEAKRSADQAAERSG